MQSSSQHVDHEAHRDKGTFLSARPGDLAPAPAPDALPVPDDESCVALWDKYAVPDHIRRHSQKVADIALALAERGEELGAASPGMARAVRASAMLHDLGKMYCIEHGGSHAQVGASWVLAETRNPALAQGVLHHVWWPFDVDAARHFLSLAVLYADKRVQHDRAVSLGARFTDLFERYGKTERARERITQSLEQSRAVEHTFNELLEVKLNACSFDSGRLVA
ncbi:HDIG domain-containing metalloprotein [Desulfocurvus sp. DL9XJH121]